MTSTTLNVLVLVLTTTAALAQESAASRPSPPLELPTSDQATPFKEKDPIVASIVRVSVDQGAASRPADSLDGWQIVVADQAFELTKLALIRLQNAFLKLAKAELQGRPGSPSALLINADASAPYVTIIKLIEAAAGARIYRIWVGVASKPVEGTPAFDTWLPRDTQGPIQPTDDIRVLLSWSTVENRLERTFGQRLVAPTAEGNRELERLIREAREEYAKRGNANVPLILDCGPRVPWQSVIDVLSIGRRAGVKRLEFGFLVGK